MKATIGMAIRINSRQIATDSRDRCRSRGVRRARARPKLERQRNAFEIEVLAQTYSPRKRL